MKNFALTGVAGYIAPRHLQAIHATGNRLEAALDPHDSVGILDRYFPDCKFFTEFERFDRHLEKLRRADEDKRVHYVSICSPNYLHDAHIRVALRAGAHAICEKPIVIKPWNLDAIEELIHETGGSISTVLQLRLHPALMALKERIAGNGRAKHDVCLTYITPRGPWYHYSWKGMEERSGGVAMNIGIHFFDLLLWIFGKAQRSTVHLAHPSRMAGFLELERANVRWFLSIDRSDLPDGAGAGSTFRSVIVDGEEVEFSEGFTDLHTRVYEQVLAGNGFGIAEARPSIELVYQIRNSKVNTTDGMLHPFLNGGQRRGHPRELLQA